MTKGGMSAHNINRRRVMAGLAAGTLAAGLGGCRMSHYTFRYKLTLEVEVKGEVYSGFSVVEQSFGGQAALGPGMGTWSRLRGEALYLDLGPNNRPLVALLDRPIHPRRTESGCLWNEVERPRCLALLYGLPAPTWGQGFREYVGWSTVARQRGAREITPDRLPDLVTFRDIGDPKSVMEVDPIKPGEALGVRFRWRRMTLEITDEPITTGIEKKLGWAKSLRGSIGRDMDLPYLHFLNRLNDGSFWQGTKK